jgi:hypothetical protein
MEIVLRDLAGSEWWISLMTSSYIQTPMNMREVAACIVEVQ